MVERDLIEDEDTGWAYEFAITTVSLFKSSSSIPT